MRLTNQQIKLLIGGAVIVALTAGGLFFSGRNKVEEEPINPEITLEPTKQMTGELIEPMTLAEKQAIEEVFAKEGVEMTLLKDVTGGQAVGTAWRLYDGTKFYHKVEASNLIEPDKGYFYEGWLVGENGFFSTGRLAVEEGKGVLYYVSDEDKTSFRGTVLTRESEDGNPAPAGHVLEGSF